MGMCFQRPGGLRFGRGQARDQPAFVAVASIFVCEISVSSASGAIGVVNYDGFRLGRVGFFLYASCVASFCPAGGAAAFGAEAVGGSVGVEKQVQATQQVGDRHHITRLDDF